MRNKCIANSLSCISTCAISQLWAVIMKYFVFYKILWYTIPPISHWNEWRIFLFARVTLALFIIDLIPRLTKLNGYRCVWHVTTSREKFFEWITKPTIYTNIMQGYAKVQSCVFFNVSWICIYIRYIKALNKVCEKRMHLWTSVDIHVQRDTLSEWGHWSLCNFTDPISLPEPGGYWNGAYPSSPKFTQSSVIVMPCTMTLNDRANTK